MKAELEAKLTQSCSYQCELLLYTWQIQVQEGLQRGQLKQLKRHFKRAIETILAQAGTKHGLAEQQAKTMFDAEWASFERDLTARLEATTKTRRACAEEVCMVFNHVVRQSRHQHGVLHVLEAAGAQALLAKTVVTDYSEFFAVRNADQHRTRRDVMAIVRHPVQRLL